MKRIIVAFVLAIALALTFSNLFVESAIALESKAQKAEQGAEQVLQEKNRDETKAQFGQKDEGARVIDEARQTANKKLKTMSEKAQKEEKTDAKELAPNEQNFLEKVRGN
jgi:type II secretory pathway pseudopilin PulG